MENFLSSTLFFLLMLAFRLFSSWLDYNTSLAQIEYGMTEANKINQDAFGRFSPAKYWKFQSILIGIPIPLYFWMGGWAAFFYAFSFISILRAVKNRQMEKKSREKQLSFLRELRAIDPDDKEAMKIQFAKILWTTKGGQTYFFKFNWIYSTDPDQWVALAFCIREILALSRKPESEWFDTRWVTDGAQSSTIKGKENK